MGGVEEPSEVATDSSNLFGKDEIEYLTLEDLGKVLDELAKSRSKSCIYSLLHVLHFSIEFLYS